MFTEKSVQEEKGFGLFCGSLTGRSAPTVALSPSQLEVVARYSNAEVGNPFYTSHLRYLQHLLGIVEEGGSVLCDHAFPRAAIEKATLFPASFFEPLDNDWKVYARKAQLGRLGLVIPPLLSTVLNNCARRDAIPAVITDIRRDWAGARRKIWQLVEAQKNARTLRELNEIDREFAAASKSLSPTKEAEGSSPLRMLWDIFAAAAGGAVTAKLAGGNAEIGAMTGVANKIIGCAADAWSLLRRGAFDLAGRIQSAVINVSPMPDKLSQFLSESEKRALGYTSPAH